MRKTKDYLIKKQEALQKCTEDYSNAIRFVHNAMENLQFVEKAMEDEIQATSAYIQGLQETMDDMIVERDRNHRIISNFRKLLEEDL